MHTGRILIASVDRLDALDPQQRMSRMGHMVLPTARSSDEALRLAAAWRPDVVVMDLELPRPLDGIQAGTQIWARLGIPVIYVSAHVPEVYLQRLWPTSLAGLLSKHTGARDLHQAIEEMLARRAQPPANHTTRGCCRPPPPHRSEGRGTAPSHQK